MFRQIRNKCTQAIQKANVSYFKEQFSLYGSNPKKFWKTVKDLENKPSSSQLLVSLKVDDVVITDMKLDPKKTSGSDGLDHFFFIKVAPPIIAKPVYKLFNLSLLSGEVPIAWKTATVHPLFKGEINLILNQLL